MITDPRIRAAADGNSAAISSLTEEYRDYMEWCITWRLLRLGLISFKRYADDLFDNPHMLMWKACKKYKPEYGTFKKHLSLICNNAATNAVRTAVRRASCHDYTIDPETLERYASHDDPPPAS